MTQAAYVELGLLGCFILLAASEFMFLPTTGSRATSQDGRLITNFGLTALVLLTGSLLTFGRLGSSLATEHFNFGLNHLVRVPWAMLLVITLLLESFAFYWLHRLSHSTPLLWRLHRVHHAD